MKVEHNLKTQINLSKKVKAVLSRDTTEAVAESEQTVIQVGNGASQWRNCC